MNFILQKHICSQIDRYRGEPGALIVLKGIPLTAIPGMEDVRVNLDEIIANKLGHLMRIFGKRNLVAYEEFLLMSTLLLEQYKTVYVLNNNLYMDQYPVEEIFPGQVRDGLLTHFSDSEMNEETDERYIGDIGEYIALYNHLQEYNGRLLGVYCDEKLPLSDKIIPADLFEWAEDECRQVSGGENVREIKDEEDYIDLVQSLFSEPEEIYVRICNYTGNSGILKSRIRMLTRYWRDCTDIYVVQAAGMTAVKTRREYRDILKKYWGYDSFQSFAVYDMTALEEGRKEVRQVSQEEVVSQIVAQAERCAGADDSFRDIFTTAPTGAGKSVMFQVPAIYLAEQEEHLLTIVISPLIGLMNDQVKNLELRNYKAAETINSDISPVIKEDIIKRVAAGECHILYISPETLLGRSDVEQLIGNRTIGMIVIDEAHIVTTWGKQFRPDYWYLGDHIRKLRKTQMDKKGRAFVIATFTATAIYHGIEDMYTETINSLHMIEPVTYLGYVIRDDIYIDIEHKAKNESGRTEYEMDKFLEIEKLYKRVKITRKKTLIYFPTVALIERCYDWMRNKRLSDLLTKYHGALPKEEKAENYERFLKGEKLIMLATKAFGMGIDISDIEIVYHFAPTGNVCDYVQEIGRSARDRNLLGEAKYLYDRRDFKHINRLHGLSAIQRYHLVEVVKKIDELYQQGIREKRGVFTRKRNAMLLDAENFTYIFGTPVRDEGDNINKVKTALLMIQKDFENRRGYSPFVVRPVPMFSIGFFEIAPEIQRELLRSYPNCLTEISRGKHICQVKLSQIWERDYQHLSFPKFKYMLYSANSDLEFVSQYPMQAALCVDVSFASDCVSQFDTIWGILKDFIHKMVLSATYTSAENIIEAITARYSKFNRYKARSVCEVVLASMDSYRRNFQRTAGTIVKERTTNAGKTTYEFNRAADQYFQWVEKVFRQILAETANGRLYLINDGRNRTKEFSAVLGILEALDVLTFQMIGGANSQIYIYINQIQILKNILNAPARYKNQLLDTIADRHLISVKMLTYLYENDFHSEEIWRLIEDYFLGIIPDKVKQECRKQNPELEFN